MSKGQPPSTETDLVTLFQFVRPLLHACIDDNIKPSRGNSIANLRTLRLVNKECSRVAPLGLMSYHLTLKGLLEDGKDTNIDSAKLLQHARLERLKVNLLLSGTYNPASLLEGFVRAVGDTSLSKVTSLILHYENTGSSAESVATLGEAMALLAAACPFLKSLRFQGHLPVTFLRSVGAACLSLTALTIDACDEDLPYLQELMLLQPSLLPNISSLSLPGIDSKLPNMLQNIGILSLEMQNLRMRHETDWLCMPGKLKHLKCAAMNQGPPTSANSGNLLSGLLSMEFQSVAMDLRALTCFLREAPFPHQIKPCVLIILCLVNESTAADLSYLNLQIQLQKFRGFECDIRCSWGRLEEAWSPSFLHALPRMAGIKWCSLDCMDANLLPMLQAFPDAEHVSISHCDALTDLELHSLMACTQARCIDLFRCNSVTPMGLLALCQHFSGLERFCFESCDLLDGPQLELCVQLLSRYGVQVHICDHALEQYEVHHLADENSSD